MAALALVHAAPVLHLAVHQCARTQIQMKRCAAHAARAGTQLRPPAQACSLAADQLLIMMSISISGACAGAFSTDVQSK
eukprot:74627-Chlamydomonas_euryale.AAC.19